MKRSAAAEPLTEKGFQATTGVGDSVLARLRMHVALLQKWQRRINLVSSDSLDDVWRRHVLDSAQLLPHVPAAARTVADIGSGAGFPGMVLAIMNENPRAAFHLVESNGKKCAFLREVNRETGAGAIIHESRIENLSELSADVVTARAVTSLERLLPTVYPVLEESGQCIFLKGRKWREELTKAKKNWIINESEIRSLSDPSGTILKLEAITRRDGT